MNVFCSFKYLLWNNFAPHLIVTWSQQRAANLLVTEATLKSSLCSGIKWASSSSINTGGVMELKISHLGFGTHHKSTFSSQWCKQVCFWDGLLVYHPKNYLCSLWNSGDSTFSIIKAPNGTGKTPRGHLVAESWHLQVIRTLCFVSPIFSRYHQRKGGGR